MRPLGIVLGVVLAAGGACAVAQDAAAPAAPRPARPPGVVDVRDYPPGITVLGPAPARAPDAPVIRVRSVPAPPDDTLPRTIVLPWPEWNLVFIDPRLLPREVVPGTPATGQPITIGPGPEEQLAVFGKRGVRPGAAGPPLAPRSTWTPTAAWPARDDPAPYPWNPARFSKPVFDPAWTPTESWSRRNALPDGSRTTWPAAPVDSGWQPGDAWQRTLAAPPSTAPAAAPASAPATPPESPAAPSPPAPTPPDDTPDRPAGAS